MAKDKSFAAKIAKASGASSLHCPTCGEIKNSLLVVEAFANKNNNGHKFKESYVPVCKCNQNEVMG